MKGLIKVLIILGMAGLLLASEKISLRQPTDQLKSEVSPIRIETPLNIEILDPMEILDQQIDTLKNDDGNPYYYWSPPTAIFAARLTPIAPCTLQYLVFMKYRKADTLDPTVCGCSLFVWRDTVIGGQHQPGRLLIYGSARESLPRSPYNVYWIRYNLTNLNFRLGADHFWTGFRWFPVSGGGADPTDTLWALSDSIASEPDRNAAALTSAGPWTFYPYDYIIRAIVKREPADVPDIEALSVGNSQGFFLPNPGNALLSGRIKNSGTIPANNFPVACTVYNSAGVAVYNSTVIVPTLAVGRETTLNFIPNWTPNTDGVYIIAVHSLLSGDMRPSNDRQIREAQVCSSPAELRYDDGEADNAWAFYRRGNGWANKFTPPYYPCQLTAIKYFLWGSNWPVPGGNRLVAKVLDDDGPNGFPGTVLYQDTITIARGQYNTINLPTPLTFNSGSFYVAYIQPDTWIYSPGLGSDEDAPFALERYIYLVDSLRWFYNPDYGEWMIRAVIQSLVYDVGCTRIISPTGTIQEGTPITPACSVYNYGNQTVSYSVRMRIGTVYNQTASVSAHTPGTLRYLTFPTWTAGPVGTHPVTCTTELSGDINPGNDRRTGSVEVTPPVYLSEEIKKITGIRILPNPTRGITKISFQGEAILRIYNAYGELVYSSKSKKGYFPIGKLPAGIYLLRFSAKGVKEERKLIVVK